MDCFQPQPYRDVGFINASTSRVHSYGPVHLECSHDKGTGPVPSRTAGKYRDPLALRPVGADSHGTPESLRSQAIDHSSSGNVLVGMRSVTRRKTSRENSARGRIWRCLARTSSIVLPSLTMLSPESRTVSAVWMKPPFFLGYR